MTFDKRDAIIEQLMADHNAAMAATATIATTVASMNISHSEVSEEDSVQ
jgi:hypothetical protein